MAYGLTDIGEEWYTETALNGATVEVTVYNSSTDTVTEDSDLGAITEPGGGSYSRTSDTVSLVKNSNGDWGIENGSTIELNVSDSTMTVDSGAVVVNFDSDEAGDGGTATDHLVGTGALTQSRDLSQVDTLKLDPGDVNVSVD